MGELGSVGAFLTSRGIGSAPASDLRVTLRQLEEGGFPTVWFGESTGREALTNAALALSTTVHMNVGTAIATMFGRDPVAAANGARTLVEAWGPRFVLGLGVSHPPMVVGRGHEYRRPVATATEYLTTLRGTEWSGPELPPPPVMLAALGPRMLSVARDHADGAITWLGTVDHTRRAREVLGGDRLLAVGLAVAVEGGEAEARDQAVGHLGTYLRLENYRRHFRRSGLPDTVGEIRPVADQVVAWGDDATVAARVREHLAAGADHVLLRIVGAARNSDAEHLVPLLDAFQRG